MVSMYYGSGSALITMIMKIFSSVSSSRGWVFSDLILTSSRSFLIDSSSLLHLPDAGLLLLLHCATMRALLGGAHHGAKKKKKSRSEKIILPAKSREKTPVPQTGPRWVE